MARCDWCPAEAPEGQKFCSDFCEKQADEWQAEVDEREARIKAWEDEQGDK